MWGVNIWGHKKNYIQWVGEDVYNKDLGAKKYNKLLK